MNKCQKCGCSYANGYLRCPDCAIDAKPESPAPKRFAEMTGAELHEMYFRDSRGRNETFAALRDAIRAEAYADASDEYTRRLVAAQGRAERAEQERDAWEAEAELQTKNRDYWRGCHQTDTRDLTAKLRTAEQERDTLKVRDEWAQGEFKRWGEELRTLERDRTALKAIDTIRVDELNQLRAKIRTAESALGEARRELAAFEPTDLMPMLAEAEKKGAREALTRLVSERFSVEMSDGTVAVLRGVERFRDRHYPATPSGEGVTQRCPTCGCDGQSAQSHHHATPQPSEPLDIEAWGKDAEGRDILVNVRITASDARRLVAMGQEGAR